MPWHLSASDPRKVYDSHHNAVCVCWSADQAALIIRAVNALGPQDESIKLREPAREGKESLVHQAAEQGAVSVGSTAKRTVPNTFDEDACCTVRLARSLAMGKVPGDEWTCRCGAEWKAQIVGQDGSAVRHWSPVAAVAIFR